MALPCPAAQGVHAPRFPGAVAYLPVGQAVQAVPPLANWPAGQVSATAVHEKKLTLWSGRWRGRRGKEAAESVMTQFASSHARRGAGQARRAHAH